jgi:phosphoribosylformylglycinamidine (FGAM) synthase-like amidotransferase family enzyme
MKSSVITFPGSNCDRDIDVALKKFGFKNKMVWHNDVELPKSDLVDSSGRFFVWRLFKMWKYGL